jgi:hypothetical protein
MNTMEVKILAKRLKKTINHLKSDGNTHQNTSAFLSLTTGSNWDGDLPARFPRT